MPALTDGGQGAQILAGRVGADEVFVSRSSVFQSIHRAMGGGMPIRAAVGAAGCFAEAQVPQMRELSAPVADGLGNCGSGQNGFGGLFLGGELRGDGFGIGGRRSTFVAGGLCRRCARSG